MQAEQNKFPVQTISWIILAIWVGYLVLSPFYIFPKGRPQPADFLLICGILPFLVMQFLTMKTTIKPVFMFGGLFVLMTIIINLINHLVFDDVRFILTMMIYPYNFLVFIFITALARRDREQFIKATYLGIAVAIIIQLVMLTFFDAGYRGYRGTGGFENPNQFAYWSLLTATMIIFLRRGEKLKLTDFILLAVLGYFQTLALSKAGIIAFAILCTILLITPKIPKQAYAALFILITAASIFTLVNHDKASAFFARFNSIQNAAERIESIGEEPDDSAQARGYFRLIEHPQYTLLGAGEGAFDRFPDDKGHARELHSGIATIIFSYGIFGAAIFFTFLLLVINKQPWFYILLFMPIFLFGLPHQNFRFAHFWVLLGINYGLVRPLSQEEKP
jgi:hypothetical protein